MKEVIVKTTSPLSCTCDCLSESPVVLCLKSGLLTNESTFLEATLTTCSQICVNGFTVYSYTVSYDESLLLTPTYNLINSDVKEILCRNCILDYIDEKVAALHIGLPEYANNAAALGGGLAVGDFYRTGADPDLIAVVH